MKKLHLVLIGVVLLFTFAIFSRSIKRGAMRQTDFAVTVKVQERIDKSSRLRFARLTGEVMEGATYLASPMIASIAVLLVTLLTFVKLKKWRITSMLILLAFGLMTLIEIYGKSVVHHPAPPFFLLKNPTTVFPKYYVWEEFSYPSGHTARAVFIAIVALSLFTFHFSLTKKKLGRWWTFGVLGAYVGIVALSRVYLGHHWISDILGGGLLGSAFGFIAVSVL